jgi:MerR family mercuric resistance operon transcriptional regulator
MESLTIGQLAIQARVNRETVRYYERRRLIPRPSRSISGYRLFSDDAVRRLGFIRHAKALGFSLNEIRELLALRVNSAEACDRVRAQAQTKLVDIDNKLQSLRRMKGALTRLVAACEQRGKTSDCPILDTLEASGEEI